MSYVPMAERVPELMAEAYAQARVVRGLLDNELIGRLSHAKRSAVEQLARELDAYDVFGDQCSHELSMTIEAVERICEHGTTRFTACTEEGDEYEEKRYSADAAALMPRLCDLKALLAKIHAATDLVRAEAELGRLHSRYRGTSTAAPGRVRR